MRVSFLGDTLCEPLLLTRSKTKNGEYDFKKTFSRLNKLFAKSDYVVCNLETPLAGPQAGYTDSLFCFNAPLEFAEALKGSGIDLVLTANNHCLDRGETGALETIKELDSIGLSHTGTFLKDSKRNYHITEIGGRKIAFISFTYGTNFAQNHQVLSPNSPIKINMLANITAPPGKKPAPSSSSIIKKALMKLTSQETRIKIKKKLGMSYYQAYRDDHFNQESIAESVAQLITAIEAAKAEADYVVLCPHMGGQFNSEPGAFSKMIMDLAVEHGCDAVIASHPHVVQKALFKNGVPCFFSLGNFAMSPNSAYLLPDNLPEYGIVAHLDFPDQPKHTEGNLAKEDIKVSFSIIRSIEKDSEQLVVWPLVDLFQNSDTVLKQRLLSDARKIVKAVSCKDDLIDTIVDEYVLEMNNA